MVARGIMQIDGPPSLLAGRYQLDQRKATGGYGEVWRALDTLLQRTVAVKLLRAEISGDSGTQARFRDEARHAGSVTHENIAQIYDYCEPGPDQPAFLVMEYVDGPSLGEMLASGPYVPARSAAAFGAGRGVLETCARTSAATAAAVLVSSTAPPAASRTRRDTGRLPAPRRSPSPRICVSRSIPAVYRLPLTLTGCELFCTRRTERNPAVGSSVNAGRRRR